ncbi:MAG: carbohydrate ABC transporter permease [Propionicimonas sp.]|uniref:carbohydrate ABC transporter permease n=1 Tax=Propionicimonas sp. TaxID=1955623 RepID=UPI002B1FB3F3|nr:carbohydrate ABC transporter permease [Propionicimonas sp.]MEA4943222.1 carbohydrate ABC transporter permease [Propionicimonas sp.]MEA5055876.1 carbohydrate ABC transporter permease [Propionicimonas sp.]
MSAVTDPQPAVAASAASSGGRRRRSRAALVTGDRGVLSESDRRSPAVAVSLGVINVVLFVLLVVACLGPLLLLVKFAVTPTQDILRTPLALFPNGIRWENLTRAWNEVQINRYFLNTVVLAAGSWFFQLLVATTGGYVLSVLRPKYAKLLNGLVISTLFVPAVVLLVPLYLTVLNPPLIGHSLLNTYWAVWLPSAASAFNVMIVARFFDSLPHEVFEAARVDGAGPFRLFTAIVLPMSKPILGVASVFAIIASWKDFLWPLLVLKQPDLQPLSVRLPSIQAQTDLGVFLAALAISTVVPVIMFLVFQRAFLRGAGMSGAVKG